MINVLNIDEAVGLSINKDYSNEEIQENNNQ